MFPDCGYIYTEYFTFDLVSWFQRVQIFARWPPLGEKYLRPKNMRFVLTIITPKKFKKLSIWANFEHLSPYKWIFANWVVKFCNANVWNLYASKKWVYIVIKNIYNRISARPFFVFVACTYFSSISLISSHHMQLRPSSKTKTIVNNENGSRVQWIGLYLVLNVLQ